MRRTRNTTIEHRAADGTTATYERDEQGRTVRDGGGEPPKAVKEAISRAGRAGGLDAKGSDRG